MGGSFGPLKGNFKAKYKPERSRSNTLSPSATPGRSNSVAIRSCSDRFRFGEFIDDGTTVVGNEAKNQILLNIPVNMRRIVETARVLSSAVTPYASDPFIDSSYQFSIEDAVVKLEFTAPESISGTVGMFVTSNGDDVITPENVLSVFSSLPPSAKCEVDCKGSKSVSFRCGLTYLQEDPASPQFDPRLVFGGYIVAFIKMPFVAGLASEPSRAYLGPVCSAEMRVTANYHGFQYGRTNDNDLPTPVSHPVTYALNYVPGVPFANGSDFQNSWGAVFLANEELTAALNATADRERANGQLIGTTGSISEHVKIIPRGPRPLFLSDGDVIPEVSRTSTDGSINGSCLKAAFSDSGPANNQITVPPLDIQYSLFQGQWIVRVFSSPSITGTWNSDGWPSNTFIGTVKPGSACATTSASNFFGGKPAPTAQGNAPLFLATKSTYPPPTARITLWMETIRGKLMVKSTYGQPLASTPAVARYEHVQLTRDPLRLADVRQSWILPPTQRSITRIDGELFLDGSPFLSADLPTSWEMSNPTEAVSTQAHVDAYISVPSLNVMGPGYLEFDCSDEVPILIDTFIRQQFGRNLILGLPNDFYADAVSYHEPALVAPVDMEFDYHPDDGPVKYDGGDVPHNMRVVKTHNGPVLRSVHPKIPIPTRVHTRPTRKAI